LHAPACRGAKAVVPGAAGGSTCAVVIAAGAGRRLRSASARDETVKPLTRVLGVPLVVRTLVTLRSAGIVEVVLVTGYRARELEEQLRREPLLTGLTLRFVRNRQWRKQNGLSVLAAREAVGLRRFYLSMADHLYSPRVLRALASTGPGEDLALAVDYRTAAVADPEDAMWVRTGPGRRIADIGKDLAVYDAVDTGVFLCTTALFDALDQERDARGGDCALADGVRRLARAGRARAVSIGDAWWHDVDTPDDLRLVEVKLRAFAAHDDDVVRGQTQAALSASGREGP
jgi:1L-myo-inositol 1-phosphate cytidylyltransferase